MSGIVLSASVRQNLLSLQSTAELLATTQNRLSTGKKVNTALDNPPNYFTAQGLDNRANDISNLLDGIGNGVQVLQAANTGLTSLQKLVDTAKSIANQVLQAPAGYSPKSTVTSAVALTGNSANLVDGTIIKAGDVLTIASTGGGTATSITFGASESLDQLNVALAANNLSASLDSASAKATMAKITSASDALRTQASTLGSNLSIVQIRQDFSKNLINVLQTGSANLTLADTNEEAANSQALATRQSIAVSALALANQAQASVLQLLR